MREPDLVFDPYDPAFVTDGVPYDVLARIRRDEPVYRSPVGSWFLSRHDDVATVLKDVGTFRADLAIHALLELADIPDEELFLSELLEPRHGKVRRIFNSCLAAHRMKDLEPAVSAICHRLVDDMFATRPADLHGGYALRIPALVMAEIMGLGDEAESHFSHGSHDGSLMYRKGTPGMPPEGPPIQTYFAGYLARHRNGELAPNRVFSALIDAEIDGAPLTDGEIVLHLHTMIQAGVHTTRSLLTHAVHRLLHDPATYQNLAGERALISRFVEESLRHDSPVLRTTRRPLTDVVIGGCPIAAGERVDVGIGSASRDDMYYEDADVFSLDRADPFDHFAFGGGAHICPGATLARLEAATALNVLFDRVAEMRAIEGHAYRPIPGSLGHQPIPAELMAR